MSRLRIVALTGLAMLAFAGNSLLCRAALDRTLIDAAGFTTIRLLSGAVVLWMIVHLRPVAVLATVSGRGRWLSAFALFAYAAGFSFAYVSLSAATGALLLFGAVQATMIAYGVWRGERMTPLQSVGLMLALGGLVALLLPGLSAPEPKAAAMMLVAGMAWGVYSLRGKGAGDPTAVTAGNFLRAALFSVVLSLAMSTHIVWDVTGWDVTGISYAIASGALTSGVGYALWYTVLPELKSTHAATVQLSVPVIAALGAVVLLGEAMTLRLMLATLAIIGGIALVVLCGNRR